MSGVKLVLELSKNEWPQASMSSAAQLLKRLAEESLEREATAHLDPNLAHCEANLRADLEQPQTNRADLRVGQMGGSICRRCAQP